MMLNDNGQQTNGIWTQDSSGNVQKPGVSNDRLLRDRKSYKGQNFTG
jgi:hypothetical protein